MARTPKPLEVKRIEGNRGKRSMRKQEPDPVYLDNLEPPAHLDDDVKAQWRSLAPRLRRTKLLTELDIEPLEMLCTSIVEWRKATAKSKDDAAVAEQTISPWKIIQSMAFKQSDKLFAKFGMTPADRARILIEPQLPLFPTNEPGAATTENRKGPGYFTGGAPAQHTH